MIFDTILISSKDRASGTKSQFTVNITSDVYSKMFLLKHAQLTNSFYTFRNQTVNFNNGVSSNVVLNGKYTATSLAAFILATLPAGYTSVYNSTLERLIFTNAAPFVITFPDAYTATAFGFPGVLITSAALSHQGTDPPDMLRYKTVLIFVNEIGSNSTSTNAASFTYTVPVNAQDSDILAAPNNGQIFYNKFHYDQQTYSNLDVGQRKLSICVYGDDKEIIPSTEMQDWSMILATDPRFNNKLQ